MMRSYTMRLPECRLRHHLELTHRATSCSELWRCEGAEGVAVGRWQWCVAAGEAHSLLADQTHVAVPELDPAFLEVEEGRITGEGALHDALAGAPI